MYIYLTLCILILAIYSPYSTFSFLTKWYCKRENLSPFKSMLCRSCTCPESSEKTEWILSISRLAWSNQNTLVASNTSNKEQTSAKCHRTRILRVFFSSSLATWPVIASQHSKRLLGVLHLITPNRAILNWNDGENPGTRSQANRWEPVINFT